MMLTRWLNPVETWRCTFLASLSHAHVDRTLAVVEHPCRCSLASQRQESPESHLLRMQELWICHLCIGCRLYRWLCLLFSLAPISDCWHCAACEKREEFPDNHKCTSCRQSTCRLLLPELSTYRQDPEWTTDGHKRLPNWRCDLCFQMAILYFNPSVFAETPLPKPVQALLAVDICVTDFELRNLLMGRMRGAYLQTLRVMDGVDATAPNLVSRHCSGNTHSVLVPGSPHINTLGERQPVDQPDQPWGMTNPEWKVKSITAWSA